MQKIVTLIPSATEIVAFLGKKDLIVGRSHECDYPKDLSKIIKLTSPKINVEGTSEEIHKQINVILENSDADDITITNFSAPGAGETTARVLNQNYRETGSNRYQYVGKHSREYPKGDSEKAIQYYLKGLHINPNQYE